MNAWTQNNGHGSLWNGTAWVDQVNMVVNPTGDQNCPAWTHSSGMPGGTQGCANFVGTFPLTAGDGVDVRLNATIPNLLTHIRWRTSGPACWGTSANTGTSDIVFWPRKNTGEWGEGLLLGGSEGGVSFDLEEDYDFIWVNSSVTVE